MLHIVAALLLPLFLDPLDLLHSTPRQREMRVRALTEDADGAATWKLYRDALATLRPWSDALRDSEGPDVSVLDWPGPAELALRPAWSEPETRAIQNYLKTNRAVITALATAAGKRKVAIPPKFERGRFSELDCTPLWSRTAAELFLLQAAQARMKHDNAAALSHIRIAWHIAEHAYQQPSDLLQRVGMWIETQGHRQLLRVAETLDEPSLAKLLGEAAQCGATTCPSEKLREIEAMIEFEFYSNCVAWSHNRKDMAAFEKELEIWFPRTSELAGGPPPGTMDELQATLRDWPLERLWGQRDARLAYYAQWAARPFHERWAEAAKFDEEYRRLARDEPLGKLTDVGGLLTPSSGAYLVESTKTARNATSTALAVLAFRAVAHRLPHNLAELGKRYPALDSTDRFSGVPLIYREAPGNAWTLYSVGTDQRDDGGRHNGFARETGDFVYWPPPD